MSNSARWRTVSAIFLEQSLYCVFRNNKGLTSLWCKYWRTGEQVQSRERERDTSNAEQSRAEKIRDMFKTNQSSRDLSERWDHKIWMNPAGLNLPSEKNKRLLCLECIVDFCCCFVGFLVFIAFSFLFYFCFFLCSCCLILIIQSQSLSRRTTPFAPRVQVMGPVRRAHLYLVFAHLTCRLAFFLFPYFGKCIPWGNGSFKFPPQCSALCHSL